MLSLYDLTCDGLIEPCGVREPLTLSFRAGSDRAGARLATVRVIVTSMEAGEVVWDTGEEAFCGNDLTYRGAGLRAGVTYVWFVQAKDDAGERACSVPALFTVARAGEIPRSRVAVPCVGVLATGDGPTRLFHDEGRAYLDEDVWGEEAGLDLSCLSQGTFAVDEIAARERTFVQASVLVREGLIVVRWEFGERDGSLALTVPPGLTCQARLDGRELLLGSGSHILQVSLRQAS